MSDGNRSPPIAVYRHQAVSFDGKFDGKFGAPSIEVSFFQVLIKCRRQLSGSEPIFQWIRYLNGNGVWHLAGDN